MQGLFTLLCLGIVMAIASFLAGILPLSFSLSPSQLRLMSTVGMGVLVGTSLIVIIPEGVETLYGASNGGHGHVRRSLDNRSVLLRRPDPFAGTIGRSDISDVVDPFLTPGLALPDSAGAPPPTSTIPGLVGILEEDTEENGGKGEKESHHQSEKEPHGKSDHAWMGVALISGFILMFLIDKLPQYTSPSKSNQRPYHISLNDLGRGFQRTPSPGRGSSEAETFLENNDSRPRQSRSFATTIGLVIHAAADGIALGASSSTSNKGLSFIIFLAIMVHKAPAAFGLTSVLLKQGLSKRSARTHLLVFSLAAPIGAILTWIFARSLASDSVGDDESTTWWTGFLLLFSGGTFLYVAMHTMQEVGSSHHEPQVNGSANGLVDGRGAQHQEQKPSVIDLLAAVFGMTLPLWLNLIH